MEKVSESIQERKERDKSELTNIGAGGKRGSG
jgi:hypothetical protein